MSRYCGPRLRIVRRLGELPGLTQKTTKIQAPPGQHGALKKKAKMSQYSARLAEKQRLRFNYGITEKKLLAYVKKAAKSKNATGDVLLQLLEMRLDNVLFRLGFAPSIAAARQIINHKQICVNKEIINIASYQCQPTDIISVLTTKKKNKAAHAQHSKPHNTGVTASDSQENLSKNFGNSAKLLRGCPPHLQLENEFTGKVLNINDRQHVGVVLNERLIVEFYSRKV